MKPSKNSQAELSRTLDAARQKVTVGARYIHYKDPRQQYTVLDVGFLKGAEPANEPCVIYRAEYGKRATFARPLRSWTSEVEHNGRQVPRFVRVVP